MDIKSVYRSHMTFLKHKRIFNNLRLTLYFLLALIFFIPQPLFSQTRIIPDATWVNIFFESIDELTEHMGFKPLRSISMHPGDVELRIWNGFGIQGLGGRIIKRVGDTWSSVSMYDPKRTAKVNGQYVEPALVKAPDNIDWASVWEKLDRAGIADIRDDSEIPHCKVYTDGISYVIEIARADFYRTYMVSNPKIQRSEDGDKFLYILSILNEAFGGKPAKYLEGLSGGEIKDVSFVSNEIPTEPVFQRSPEWTYAPGFLPGNLPESELSAEQVLAQAVILDTPRCEDLPKPWSFMPLSGEKGSWVGIELLISQDGSVSAARDVYGPLGVGKQSLEFAFKWKFVPSANQNQLRHTILTIQYRKQWVPFPWFK